MLPKSQHRNRGSKSFFSGSLLHSMTRGRSHPDFGIPISSSQLRSQSSLSCDPNAQDCSTASKVEGFQPDFSGLSAPSTAALYSKHARGDIASRSDVSSEGLKRHLKSRRLSWLSLSLSGTFRGDKHDAFVAIPPTVSMSSVSSSSISPPMLTSTTNARVANAAKIEHSEILFPISSRSASQSQRNLTDEFEGTTAAVNSTSSRNQSARRIRAKIGHSRRASTGMNLTTPWSRRKRENREFIVAPSITHFRKGRIARCREKLHHLRERLHVLPAEAGNDVVVQPEDVKAKEIQSHELDKVSRTSTPRVTSFLPKLHSDSTTDLLRGSFSRSFASAVDKLGLDSSPTLINDSPSMAPLRKTKSVMDLFGRYIGSDKSRDEKSDKATTTDPEVGDKTPAIDADEGGAADSDISNTDERGPNEYRSPVTASPSKDDHNAKGSAVTVSEEKPYRPEFRLDMNLEAIPPMPPTPKPRFSQLHRAEGKPFKEYNALSSTTPPPRSTHQQVTTRGLMSGIQPGGLHSHPNVTSFVSRDAIYVPATPGQRKPSGNDDQVNPKTEVGEYELKEASVYTPETDELRYYTRTPTPKISKAVAVPIRARILEETPTRQPVFNKLKKSISGFFNKSTVKANPAAAVTGKEEEMGEEKEDENVAFVPVGGRSYAPIRPSPLRNVRPRRGTNTSEEKRYGRADLGEEYKEYEEMQKHVNPPYN